MAEQETQRKIACLTPEQNDYYNSLNHNQRRYVEFRAQGYKKAEAYRMAGYDGRNPSQGAVNFEARNPKAAEIIRIMSAVRRTKAVLENTSTESLNATIDALAIQKDAENAIAKLENMDQETARRIKFFRDIISGKIKSYRKTVTKNATGAITKIVEEEINDVDTRIKARKELDKILGLNEIIDIDKLSFGDITVNIVDASKKDAVSDSRNDIVFEGEVEEKTIVENESEEYIADEGDGDSLGGMFSQEETETE